MANARQAPWASCDSSRAATAKLVSTAQPPSPLAGVTQSPHVGIGHYAVVGGGEHGPPVDLLDDPGAQQAGFEADGHTVDHDVELGVGPQAELVSQRLGEDDPANPV